MVLVGNIVKWIVAKAKIRKKVWKPVYWWDEVKTKIEGSVWENYGYIRQFQVWNEVAEKWRVSGIIEEGEGNKQGIATLRE